MPAGATRFTEVEVVRVRSFRAILVFAMSMVLTAGAAGARAATSHTKKHTVSRSHRTHHVTHRRSRRVRGQQAIDPARVTQIQQALVSAHYLDRSPDGNWDSSTKEAMQKYQADNGWQTKLLPDSRALVKLGLGPDYSDAINAKGSSFAAPPPDNTIPVQQESGFAAAAGVNH